MALDTLLEHIWSDALEERSAQDGSPISHLLTSLLAAPVLFLVDKSVSASNEPFVGYGGLEILPGASLSYVLMLLMVIEFDEKTLVLGEPIILAGETRRSTEELGRIVGRILVELSTMGTETVDGKAPSRPLISAASSNRVFQLTSIN